VTNIVLIFGMLAIIAGFATVVASQASDDQLAWYNSKHAVTPSHIEEGFQRNKKVRRFGVALLVGGLCILLGAAAVPS
jgi:uncharacterized membrane protein